MSLLVWIFVMAMLAALLALSICVGRHRGERYARERAEQTFEFMTSISATLTHETTVLERALKLLDDAALDDLERAHLQHALEGVSAPLPRLATEGAMPEGNERPAPRAPLGRYETARATIETKLRALQRQQAHCAIAIRFLVNATMRLQDALDRHDTERPGPKLVPLPGSDTAHPPAQASSTEAQCSPGFARDGVDAIQPSAAESPAQHSPGPEPTSVAVPMIAQDPALALMMRVAAPTYSRSIPQHSPPPDPLATLIDLYNRANADKSLREQFRERYAPVRVGATNAVERREAPGTRAQFARSDDGELLGVHLAREAAHFVVPRFGLTIESVTFHASALADIFHAPDFDEQRHYSRYRIVRPARFSVDGDHWELLHAGELDLGPGV